MNNEYFSPLKTSHSEKYADQPRRELLDLLNPDANVILEIGCGTGATGKVVKEQKPNCLYFGIEIDNNATKIAEGRLDKAFNCDIEKTNLAELGFSEKYFDHIIFADVLEHLYDPWKLLFKIRNFLKEDGTIIASIPNIQHIEIINSLLNGNWTYTKYGLLDATHIRFFTLKEIIIMFQLNGFMIEMIVQSLTREVNKEFWPKDLFFDKFTIKNVSQQEALNLFTFQYFIKAKKDIIR